MEKQESKKAYREVKRDNLYIARLRLQESLKVADYQRDKLKEIHRLHDKQQFLHKQIDFKKRKLKRRRQKIAEMRKPWRG